MSRNQKFVREFSIPLLAVICTTLLALVALFAVMVSQQNQLSEQREQAQLKTALAAKVDFLAENIRDYTRWTEAVRKVAQDLDLEWADETIGPYFYDNKGYTYSFVIEKGGNTIYSSHLDQRSAHQASAVLGKAFAPIIARLDGAAEGAEERFGQLVEVDGKPAIVATSAILPSLGEEFNEPFKRRYLMVVQPIDDAMLAALAKTFGMKKLSYRAGPPSTDGVTVPLISPTKQQIGHLDWEALRPGDAMGRKYLPWLALIALQAVLLTTYMFRRASRMTQDLAASEAAARHLANHDTLTGLQNRRALREKGLRQPAGSEMAILFLDLDGFKEVNDLFGHQAGDVLLKEATLRLRGIVGDKALLARVGGDEFSILVTAHYSHEVAISMAKQIVEIMAEPFSSNEIRMVVSASVGVALGQPGQSVDDLSRFADVAMYAAKDDGKNCWRAYHPEMDEGREARKIIESELREAVERNEVEVFFQPIVDAREGTVNSVEALARWTSPTQGPIGPAIFVPIAEESGLIVKLGELVLRKACLAARDWDVSLSVNLSPAQFWHGTLVEDIVDILKECNFPPERLELEITEGYLLSRPETAAEVIRRIRTHGIRVALDDFGTGFASIGYLRRFELDRLKLDKSFVEFVDTNRQSAEVTKAVIGLSHALNLPITAEGVETSPQALFLTLAGCQRLQGWHYGKAVSGRDLKTMLDAPQLVELPQPKLGIAS
jgi:diguanylate cyclase (GGDEF)-like protein